MGVSSPACTAASTRALVPSPCPVLPWRFHLMAGLRSSTHAGEQLAHPPPPSPTDVNKEYVASIRKLYTELEKMEMCVEQLDTKRWISVALLLYYATAILPGHLVDLWDLKNSKLASKLSASIKSAEEVKDEIDKELRDTTSAVTPSFTDV